MWNTGSGDLIDCGHGRMPLTSDVAAVTTGLHERAYAAGLSVLRRTMRVDHAWEV